MDKRCPDNIDPRPRRRKGKDNPYEIFAVGAGTSQPHYYVSFSDSGHTEQCVEISKALFDAFDRFELDDVSFMNEADRHYEQSVQSENSLNKRAVRVQKSVEETALQRVEADRLHKAISELSEKQRRRLLLYYFEGLTYEQIAKMEGCKYQTIQDAISTALKNLKKFLK